jgi:hypothetical protein
MQKIVLANNTPKPLEVHIEINPDRYVLQPKDEMEITGGEDPSQPHFHIDVWENSIQIYPPLWAKVSINGKPVDPA